MILRLVDDELNLKGVDADISTGLLKSVHQLGGAVGGVVAGCCPAAGRMKRCFTGNVARVNVLADAHVGVVAQQEHHVQV